MLYLDILSVLGNERDGLRVALLANQDWLSLARFDLLEGVQTLLIDAVPNHHLLKRSEVHVITNNVNCKETPIKAYCVVNFISSKHMATGFR